MKISKNWKSPLKNLLGCRETNGRVSRTGDVTGYNKRFAVHSVAKETVPFSAWKQSRGLLSWSISVVGAQAKGRTSNSSSRCATASSYARNVAVLLPLYQPREWDEGRGREEDRGQQARAFSLPFPREFRFALERNASCASGYDSWIILRIIYWDIGWKDVDGWKCWSIVSR